MAHYLKGTGIRKSELPAGEKAMICHLNRPGDTEESVKDRLARCKIPTLVEFVDDLPRTPRARGSRRS